MLYCSGWWEVCHLLSVYVTYTVLVEAYKKQPEYTPFNDYVWEHSKNTALAYIQTKRSKAIFPPWCLDLGCLCSAGVVGCNANGLFFSTEGTQEEGLSFLSFQEFIAYAVNLTCGKGFFPTYASLQPSILLSFLNILSSLLYTLAIITRILGNKRPKNVVAGRNHCLWLIAWVGRWSP